MAITPFVQGPAILYSGAGYDARAGSGATPGALSLLGISVDGVALDWSHFYDPILADTGGQQLPVTEQQMGQIARITFNLEIFDDTILNTWRKHAGTTEGVLESVGHVMAPTDYNRLFIDGVQPWNFPTARFDRDPVKIGTTRSVYRCSVMAFAYIGVALTSAGAVLYDRITTGHP